MPFAPSSPIRLYATRKARASSTTESPPALTTSKISGMQKLRNSLSSTSPTTATDLRSSIVADKNGNQQHPWREDLFAEEIGTGEQLQDLGFQGAEGTISIQEALATGSPTEDTAMRESSLAMIQPQSSFFDNFSESEYSIDEDITPVVGRASSVRVSKPQIVENKPRKTSNFHVKQSGHSTSNSQSSLKATHFSDSQSVTLPTMPEEKVQQYSGQTIRPVPSEDSNDLSPRIGSQATGNTEFPASAPTDTSALQGELTPTVAVYDSALPTGSTLRSVHPRIIHSEISSVADSDGVEASPIQASERKMSASLPSPGRGLSRRVQIRPADLITKNHHNTLSFRETVVTTPYPPRLSDDTTRMFDSIEGEGLGDTSPGMRKQSRKQKQRVSAPSTAREKDRFPSPERPEALFLDLNIQNHPGARMTLEIEVAEKLTFDDEALFQQIKAAYQKQLLNGPRRVFSLVRKATYVTATGSTHSIHSYRSLFNGANFLEHMQNPCTGRRRKTWVLWLRNQNTSLTSIQNRNSTSRVRHINDLTRLSTLARTSSHSRHSSQSTKLPFTERNEHKSLSTASETDSFYFAYTPIISKLSFLSARHENSNFHSKMHLPTTTTGQTDRASCRSFVWPGNLAFSTDCESHQNLTITVHHSFRLTTIAALTLLNFLFAVLCATVWILFGAPGARPGSDTQQQIDVGGDSVTVATDWRVNAQGRVLPGVVIGFVVLVLGSLGEGLLLWMGRLLL